MATAVVRGFVTHTRLLQTSAAAVRAGASHGGRSDGYCADVATARSGFLRLFVMTLACAVAVGACGSTTQSSTTTTTSEVGSPKPVSTIAGRTLRDWLAGRTFILAKPDGTFPTHVLQPAATVTFALPGDDAQYFMRGYNACNFVGYSGSLDGDHVVITEAMTTAAACPYDGLGWYEPLDARLALSEDGSTVTVTASDTGQVAYLLLDSARLPTSPGASLVGTYELTKKRLLVLDENGSGRIIDAVSHVVTCPMTWMPPPALSITAGDCPADDELRDAFRVPVGGTGEVRQRGSWLFVNSLVFAKVAPAPAR
jgi:hypothetical protein